MVKYFKAAARDVHARARWQLGCACELGQLGLKKDEKIAVGMYRNAADGGSASAKCVLGVAGEFGDLGLDEDEEIAFKMYRNAADGGNQAAQCELLEEYRLGKKTRSCVFEY